MGHILVVDDHDSLRKGLVKALSNAGHDVEDAPNGTGAIERLQASQFDVVLTDLRMGGADGMDVLRTARSVQPDAAVKLSGKLGRTSLAAMSALDSRDASSSGDDRPLYNLLRVRRDIRPSCCSVRAVPMLATTLATPACARAITSV